MGSSNTEMEETFPHKGELLPTKDSFIFVAINLYYGYCSYTSKTIPIYEGMVLHYIGGKSISYGNAFNFHWDTVYTPRMSWTV